MKNVLVFFNNQPATLHKVINGVTTMLCEYPGGEVTHLNILYAGIHAVNGNHSAFCVASDRELTSQEIVEAANRLLK